MTRPKAWWGGGGFPHGLAASPRAGPPGTREECMSAPTPSDLWARLERAVNDQDSRASADPLDAIRRRHPIDTPRQLALYCRAAQLHFKGFSRGMLIYLSKKFKVSPGGLLQG